MTINFPQSGYVDSQTLDHPVIKGGGISQHRFMAPSCVLWMPLSRAISLLSADRVMLNDRQQFRSEQVASRTGLFNGHLSRLQRLSQAAIHGNLRADSGAVLSCLIVANCQMAPLEIARALSGMTRLNRQNGRIRGDLSEF